MMDSLKTALILFSTLAAWEVLAVDKQIEIAEAVQIAEQTLVAQGHADPNRSVVLARRLNTPRDDIFGTRSDEVSKEVRRKLKDKEYWLIYFRPAASGKGGDAAIYVDARTGAVIHVYLGR